MTQESITVLGLLAATLTTISFVPQLIKVWVSRSAHDISFWMFSLFSTGVALWLVYGIYIDSLPVILANSITLVLALAVLILKIRFDHFS